MSVQVIIGVYIDKTFIFSVWSLKVMAQCRPENWYNYLIYPKNPQPAECLYKI